MEIKAEAFGERQEDQNCPQAPRISIVPYGQSGSYLSQVALSGSAVDQLADSSELNWVVSGGRLRLFWCSPGGCMKGRDFLVFLDCNCAKLARDERI